MNKNLTQIKDEVIKSCLEDMEYHIVENDYEYMKRLLKEEYPGLEESEYEELVETYFDTMYGKIE